jgi:hypothetical protein
MKTELNLSFREIHISLLVFIVGALSVVPRTLADDPRTNYWLTTSSGKYARIYATDADKTSGNAVSTWSRNSLSQSLPAYSGIQEIYSSASWVYLRTTGLGSHVMGPWYLNAVHTTLFPNVPVNSKSFYRIPRNPAVPGTKTLTGLGAIGYFLDGVAMYDSRDAFYWNGTSEVNGSGNWNRDAYVNESITFDPAFAHQPGSGQYHYHANPVALRFLLRDNVLFVAASKTYSENTNNLTLQHSPILGWVRDGYPVYGPYGYSNAMSSVSGVRRLRSGYSLRNGQNGTDTLTVRTSLPAWAVRLYGAITQTGPTVSTAYPLGRYMEDNAYLGDLGQTQGTDFELDEYNGRFCVTPEFPGGTYAYFASISSTGAPTFPYNIGRAFYGSPTGNTVASLTETVVTNFFGGTNAALQLSAPVLSNSTVTLVWSAVEGGTYRIESTTNLAIGWSSKASNIVAQGVSAQVTTNRTGNLEFYRAACTGFATYNPVK